MFLGTARSDDLRHLRQDQVKFTATGVRLIVERRKNDRQAKGHSAPVLRDPDSRYCPVRLISEYLRQVPGHWLFPKMRKVRGTSDYEILQEPAPYADCKNAQADALKSIGVDPKPYGLHSSRVGSAVEYTNAGFSESEIGKRGGWAPGSRTVSKYVKQSDYHLEDMAESLMIPRKQ